ncbi:hypothetical protein FRC19_004590 [Serendipita sp. 401]|nr:hypothetical protein FRC19_004590 [Serendipita sp. 401]
MSATHHSSSNNAPSTTGAQSNRVSGPDVSPKCASSPVSPPSLGLAPDSSMKDAEEASPRVKQESPHPWRTDELVARPKNTSSTSAASLQDAPLQREGTTRTNRGKKVGVDAQQTWRGGRSAAANEEDEDTQQYLNYEHQNRTRTQSLPELKKRFSTLAGQDGSHSGKEDHFDQEAGYEQDTGQEKQQRVLSGGTPYNGSIENDDQERTEVRGLELYMGDSQDLDIYRNGWKWALIRGLEPPTDPNNTMAHTSTLADRGDDEITNVELVSMASALEIAEAEAAAQPWFNLCSTTDSSFFLTFNPWRSSSEPTLFEESPVFSKPNIKAAEPIDYGNPDAQ